MTSIEWTEKTWNPVTGCDPVSPGCAHCYAADMAKRFWGDRKFSDVQFHPDRLDQPLKRKKPTMYFVNSMSDLFHESVTDEQLDQIFAVMALTPQHTYQVLTKRPERMLEYFQRTTDAMIAYPALRIARKGKGRQENLEIEFPRLPLPNLWLGVTCENQRTADERIPLLLQTPAAVRFLSCEPLLEEVDLSASFHLRPCPQHRGEKLAGWGHLPCDCREFFDKHRSNGMPVLDWVIVGGESGPKARPCDIAWIRSIVEQCKDAEVPCFVKQLGSKPIMQLRSHSQHPEDCLAIAAKAQGKGNDPDEWPEDLRVREFPPMPVTA